MVSWRLSMLRPRSAIARERQRGGWPKYRGLYCGRLRREEKLQEGSDARGPGRFIMLCAFDALIVKVRAQAPAFLQKNIAELLDVLNDARAFFGADVEPNAGTGFDGRNGGGETINEALIPPHRRREGREASKNIGKLQTDIEREQAPKR